MTPGTGTGQPLPVETLPVETLPVEPLPVEPLPVAVVTGASRGIGRHVADALEQAGYAVERGSRQVADVTRPEEVQRWVADIVERRGKVDVLVNNAGVIDAEVPLHESDPEQWWGTVETNVRGPYLMTRAVMPHMVAAGGGRVVNLNSGSATGPGEVASAYNLSKTALARITGSTHLAGVQHGVMAFDLAPGVVRTDMTESMRAHDDRTEWTSPAQVTELLLAVVRGELDDWSGRLVRAGSDSPARLKERARLGLDDAARTITLAPYGPDDPLT